MLKIMEYNKKPVVEFKVKANTNEVNTARAR